MRGGCFFQAKGTMIKLFDGVGLFGLNKIILEHNNDQLLKVRHFPAQFPPL